MTVYLYVCAVAAGGRIIMDSTEIARWGDAHSSSPGLLFPEQHAAEVDR